MQIRDRIQELRRVRAAELKPNPRNWRTHPPAQADAMRGILAEVGYADALLARELADGTLELIDGHLRAETTPDALVPVLILDLNEEEAHKLLLAHDPLAAMAETDEAALTSLAAEVETDSEALDTLFTKLVTEQNDNPLGDLPHDATQEPPLEESFGLFVTCDSEETQQNLFERLTAAGHRVRLTSL